MLIGVENKRVYFSKSLKYDLKRAHSLCRCSLADPSREVFDQKPFPLLFPRCFWRGRAGAAGHPRQAPMGFRLALPSEYQTSRDRVFVSS